MKDTKYLMRGKRSPPIWTTGERILSCHGLDKAVVDQLGGVEDVAHLPMREERDDNRVR